MVFEQKEFTQIEGYEDYYICKETTEVLSIKKRKNTVDNTIKILKQVNNSKDPSNNYYIVTLVDSEGNRKNLVIVIVSKVQKACATFDMLHDICLGADFIYKLCL